MKYDWLSKRLSFSCSDAHQIHFYCCVFSIMDFVHFQRIKSHALFFTSKKKKKMVIGEDFKKTFCSLTTAHVQIQFRRITLCYSIIGRQKISNKGCSQDCMIDDFVRDAVNIWIWKFELYSNWLCWKIAPVLHSVQLIFVGTCSHTCSTSVLQILLVWLFISCNQ